MPTEFWSYMIKDLELVFVSCNPMINLLDSQGERKKKNYFMRIVLGNLFHLEHISLVLGPTAERKDNEMLVYFCFLVISDYRQHPVNITLLS